MIRIQISKNDLKKAYKNEEYSYESKILPSCELDESECNRILLEIMLNNYTPKLIIQEVA